MEYEVYPSEKLKEHPDEPIIRQELLGEFGEKIQYLFEYDNGYEVSVVTGFGVYGSADAPYELGLIYPGLGLVQMDGITDDNDTVSGYNTEEEILAKLAIVKTLDKPMISEELKTYLAEGN